MRLLERLWRWFVESTAGMFIVERVEDYRIVERETGEKYQFLVLRRRLRFPPLGRLRGRFGIRCSKMLLGDTQLWSQWILNRWKEGGVEALAPRRFDSKEEFLAFAKEHPILKRYRFDWGQIDMRLNH